MTSGRPTSAPRTKERGIPTILLLPLMIHDTTNDITGTTKRSSGYVASLLLCTLSQNLSLTTSARARAGAQVEETQTTPARNGRPTLLGYLPRHRSPHTRFGGRSLVLSHGTRLGRIEFNGLSGVGGRGRGDGSCYGWRRYRCSWGRRDWCRDGDGQDLGWRGSGHWRNWRISKRWRRRRFRRRWR